MCVWLCVCVCGGVCREGGSGAGGAQGLGGHRRLTTPYRRRHPLTGLQPRAGCGTRYLGASAANCTNQLVALYNKADAAALTKWKLIKV